MSADIQDNEISLVVDIAENPIIRAMLNLIPAGLGSAADILIVHQADKIKRGRVREFFRALGEGNLQLTPELIANNDFIHCLDATLRAALRSRRTEKISLFARLLRNGMINAQAQSLDDYEELVALLDDLSFREWQALLLFQKHSDSTETDPNPLARVQKFWVRFVEDLSSQLQVENDEASSFMNRIARTGLYNEITGAYWDYTGGLGTLTPKFVRLYRIIEATP